MRLIDADAMKASFENKSGSEIGEMVLKWIDMQPTVDEAVEPIIQEALDAFYMTSRWYSCGECQTPIDPGDKYCRHCGRMILWT